MLLVFFLFLVVILGVFGSEIKKEYRQAITFNLNLSYGTKGSFCEVTTRNGD